MDKSNKSFEIGSPSDQAAWLAAEQGILSGQIKDAKIPIDQSFVNGRVKINSLDVNNPTITPDASGNSFGVKGIDVSASVFGHPVQIPVTDVTRGVDGSGKPYVEGQFQMPVPEGVQTAFGIPGSATVPVRFSSGGLTDKRATLEALAKETGTTVQGTFISDQLTRFASGQPLDSRQDLSSIIQKRGIAGTESDANQLVLGAEQAPDFSFNPSGVLHTAETRTGMKLPEPFQSTISDVTQVSKQGEHVSVKVSQPIDLGEQTYGPITITGNVPKSGVSFDMGKVNGNPAIENVQGLQFKISAYGQTGTSALKSLTESNNSDGSKTYSAQFSNPTPSWMRHAIFWGSSDNVTANFRLDSTGQPYLTNQDQLQSQMVGHNPWAIGAMQELADFKQTSDGKGTASSATDVALSLGTAVVSAALLGRGRTSRFLAFTAGALISPLVVHGVKSVYGDQHQH